ncbi:cytochrome P450 [Mycobacterium sp. CVI_P3]|uniref:Cytochrome P450 n=1 Tax=Mycobacterium pinniadriaticum TaxID=2994102 RepID=A0ABT3S940_9MYCO|nr:cytochrome P450 [Mycobacterium pinniadriaticum]MCX2929597.1 cytochrome P450 [Mycobacterium pinniadriaticum]MCX2936021.1 cytochrome P450 [Mycobacterium pinniadriaticum]
MRQRLHWLTMHGVVRVAANWSARRGDPQAQMVADPAIRADPVPFYTRLRPQGPMIPTRLGYLTVDHGVAHELLRSDAFRVVDFGGNLPAPLRWLERRTRDDLLHPLRPPSLLAVEPPEHTRYRKTVSSVFTTRAVAALRDRVEQTAVDLLDGLAAGPGVVDVVERYCSQLPVAVIGDILGVPDADRPRILEFGELAAPSLDIGLSWPQYQRVQHGLAGFNQWLSAHLRHLREHPGDDLMSQLIAASEDGAHLDETELQGVAGLVLAAGFETTVNLLGNGIRLLLNSPDQLARLLAEPSLWPNAVEEILRLESPVQLSARVALTDTEVAGTPVRAGQMVVIYLAAANRDPAVFDDPHRFDVERPNAGKHLAFSGGRHFCLGAALARAEGEVGLRRFFTHFPDVQLAGLGSRTDTRVLRGWAELPVSLGSASFRPNRHFAEKV